MCWSTRRTDHGARQAPIEGTNPAIDSGGSIQDTRGVRTPLGLIKSVALTSLALAVFSASPARAELPFPLNAWNVKLDVALGLPPLNAPQSQYLSAVGIGLGLRVGVFVHKWFEPYIGVHTATYGLSAGGHTTILTVGVGGRFMYKTDKSYAPWVDVDLAFGGAGSDSTGSSPAVQFGLGVGVAFHVTQELWISPLIRFIDYTPLSQTPVPDEGSRGTTPANFLFIGVGGEWGAKKNVDRDHDGINDDVDKCPDEAEDKDGFEDEDGCPELDNDKDGVLDTEDKCPNEPGSKEAAGCPDQDHDGIPDAQDKCPTAAGPAGGDGCPVEDTGVKIKGNKLELSDKIYFAHDKAEILPKSYDILNQIVRTLKHNKDIRVVIEGHTDDVGKPKHNEELSQARALAVRDYLVGSGVSADRLEAKGYGSAQPLDTNKTPEGRENNRRVEFTIIH